MDKSGLKRLPLGYADFEKIIQNDSIYVDKTKLIYHMIKTGTYYFLSRPRRFGKSLLISTLNALFSGKRELFKGLWIDSSDYDWKTRPVIRFNFSLISHKTEKDLVRGINIRLDTLVKQNKLDVPSDYPIESKFEALIAQLAERDRVVVLIDEYDKPILDHIENVQEAKAQRDILKNFYTVIKDSDEHIHFAFFTGVSKFSKTSIFSGINNLRDITLSREYAELLGYTSAELKYYFEAYIKKLAAQQSEEPEKILSTLQEKYDGYLFASHGERMFNPFSILSCFADLSLNNHWFSTGTPTFLMDLIRKNEYPLAQIYDPIMRASDLDAFEPDNIEFTALLYQTGYLTIKNYENNEYALDFPNFEVSDGFNLSLSKTFTGLTAAITGSYAKKIWRTFVNRDMTELNAVLQAFFDEMKHDTHLRKEYDLRLLLFCVFKLIGIEVSPEVKTSRGVADLVVELRDSAYVIELKFNKTAQEAIEQIQDMKYYAAYTGTGKQIILVGINFAEKTKAVSLMSRVLKN